MSFELEPLVHERLKGMPVAGMLSRILVREGDVSFALNLPSHMSRAQGEALRQACLKALEDLPGGPQVRIVLTSEEAPPSLRQTIQKTPVDPEKLPDIRHVLAVASGKGGVGKSTVAVGVAVALAQQGLKVGLLDCDIYGPSIPLMLGIFDKPDVGVDKKILPFERYGITCMSIGCLLPPEAPMVWRGPMVHHALMQLLNDVAWGPLDVLILDMPPGTGDAHLSIAQKIKLSGVIMVSTPQDLALIDALKGWRMFQNLQVPLVGLVENMSLFACPNCGHETPLFGHGGAEACAAIEGMPFLGAIPLTMALREAGDAGIPLGVAQPETPSALIFKEIAIKARKFLDQGA